MHCSPQDSLARGQVAEEPFPWARSADSCLVLGLAFMLASCVVEPSVRPRQDAQHARDASLDAWLDAWLDAGLGADAGVCPISRPDAMACDAVVPRASDASLDPGDATCVYPQVEEDCVEGWCRIPAGCFVAGSPEDEPCRGPSDRQVQVFLTRPFLILQTEVTQEMWAEQGFPNPAIPEGCSDCPVNMVNLYEAFAYANALSESEGVEPCYELGCCVGQVGTGCPERCHPCDDIRYDGFDLEHGEGRSGPLVDPRGPGSQAWGVEQRGGCYLSYPCYSRASNHVGAGLTRSGGFGFRVVRTIFD